MKYKQQFVVSMMFAMKFTISQLVISAIFLCSIYANDAKSQADLSKTFTVNVTNTEIADLLRTVSKQTKIKFSYSFNAIEAKRTVTYSAKEKKLKEFLDEFLNKLGVGYKIVDDQVILFPLKEVTGNSIITSDRLSASFDENIDRDVSGKVLNENGEPVSGATVTQKGTTISVMTGADGSFTINVKPDVITLVISSVGFKTYEVAVGKSISTVSIVLKAEVRGLNEVVVVGYGTQRRKDITGSITKISGEVIRSTPVNSPDQAIQGRVAGVQVVQSSGAPGGAVQVRVRGTNSTAGGGANQPLYVVDGVPLLFVEGINSLSVGNEGSSGGAGSNSASPLNTISPNDIESIEVLKDASAAAIYGARAANGVVLITTKVGKIGKPQITFDMSYGSQSLRKKIPVTNARERVAYSFEHRRNAGTRGNEVFDIWAVNPFLLPQGTDWQDAAFRNAPISNYTLGISGGSDKITYSVSGDHMDQQGILLNTFSKRTGLRVNLDVKASNKLKFGTRTNLSYQTDNSAATDEYFQSNLNALTTFSPLMRPYDEFGGFSGRPNVVINGNFFGDGGGNIVANQMERIRKADRYRMISNVYGEYTIIPGLRFKSSLGIDYLATELREVVPYWVRGVDVNSPVRLSEQRNNTYNWIAEQTLTYDKRFGEHVVNAIAGFSAQNVRINTMGLGANGSLSNALNQIGNMPTVSSASGGVSDQGLVSQFVRANYSFKDRYLLTATVRRDGSSRFGNNNQYGIFPAASLGWKISNEAFLKDNKTISNLMLRASYGVLGSQNIGNFLYAALMGGTTGVFGNAYTPGLAPSRFQNEDIKWERNVQMDIGVDLSLFDGRLEITMDYYDKRTKGLLGGIPMSVISGVGNNIVSNIGEIKNSGFEFSLNTDVIKSKNFNWNFNFNVSTNKNEVVSLGAQPFLNGAPPARTLFINRTERGHPIGGFYLIQTNGQYQTWAEAGTAPIYPGQPYFAPGDMIPVDQNKDNLIDDRDRVWSGSPFPDYFGGLTNTVTWKALSLSIFAPFQHGNKIWNQPFLGASTFEGNTWRSIYENRWLPQNAGTVTTIPIPRNNNPIMPTSLYLQDGSFFRIRTISLGYEVPAAKIKFLKLSRVRLYAQANNFFVATRYQGWDPEVNSFGSNVTTNGIDIGAYPQAKSVVFGASIGF